MTLLRRIPRWLRILTRILTGILAALLLLWVGLIWYIQSHKDEILSQITTELSADMNGQLRIDGMDLSLWSGFRSIGISLQRVQLDDSLQAQHGRSLIRAASVQAELETLPLIAKKIHFLEFVITNGQIHLFTDSSGYSNNYLIRGNKKPSQKRSLQFRSFGLRDVTLLIENKPKAKRFEVVVRRLRGQSRQQDGAWHTTARLQARVKGLAFNLPRGAYLPASDLDWDLRMHFDPDMQTLYFPNQDLHIDKQLVFLEGHMAIKGKPDAFSLTLSSPHIDASLARSWLTTAIQQKLEGVEIKKPIAIQALINGRAKHLDTPFVRIDWRLRQNEVETPFGRLKECSMLGTYENVVTAGMGHGDPNSRLSIRQLRGIWRGIPLESDSIRLTNLSYPLLEMNIRSSFPLDKINEAAEGGLPFAFKGGQARLELSYRGGIKTDDTLPPRVFGYFKMTDAAVSYTPRNLMFNRGDALLEFKEDNVYIRNMDLHTNSGILHMKGLARHFFRFYFSDPGKVFIAWELKSPELDLNVFRSFVGERKGVARPAADRQGGMNTRKLLSQMDRVLEASSVSLLLDLDRLRYRNFTATNAHARALLTENIVTLEDVRLSHSGGSLKLDAVIEQAKARNPFRLNADLNKVLVGDLFRAFDNFGQTAISAEQIRGRLSARVQVQGGMAAGGQILPNSMNGTVRFKLEDGALINFEPFQKVAGLIFRRRDFSHITFKDLSNKLIIQGNRILIPPMSIRSSVMNMQVQGVYAQPKGTNIAIAMPLKNPKKEELQEGIEAEGPVERKGLVLNLKAQDGDDGSVRISLDLFKKARKTTDSLFRK